MHRQILFTGLRLGLYERLRDFLAGKNHCSAGRSRQYKKDQMSAPHAAVSTFYCVAVRQLQHLTRVWLQLIDKSSFDAGDLEEAPLYARLGAALTTSAIGITVANPSDVVKIRQQACNLDTQTGNTSCQLRFSL